MLASHFKSSTRNDKQCQSDIAIMEVDCPESPSKRVKLTHYSLDGAVEDESVSETIPKPVITKEEVPTTEHTIDALKLHKEAEVGITEYVSPDLQGFNGILKKR